MSVNLSQVYTPAVHAGMEYDCAGYVIARYLRISQEDGAENETASITHQRELIGRYIAAREEFANARIVDYVDDGVSGSHTDREAYRELMRDVKNGGVNCIVVKDLSRIGRNLLDVDDLLMNQLVVYKTRFIAINNNYDSFKHPLSNLELALINLTNQQYNKDLALKAITSRLIKVKRGEFLGAYAPFGYVKSKTEKNRLVIDNEAAEYVCLIFSLAIDGHNTTEIARILNAQGIPTASEYRRRNGGKCSKSRIDPEYCFWNNGSVWDVLNNERYTGKAISNMYRVKESGKHSCVHRPKEEWIVVPNAHEAIIPEDDYRKAHDALKRAKHKGVPLDHIFHAKVRCGTCGRAMKRLSNKSDPYFKCNTGRYTEHYNCPKVTVSQLAIEKAMLESLKIYTATLIAQEELRLEALRQAKSSKGALEGRIRAEQKAIQLLEESVVKNFKKLADGEISKETFLSKKEVINSTIAQKNGEVKQLCEQAEVVSIGKGSIDNTLAELRSRQSITKLDRDMVDLLIEKIVIYGDQQVEIVWNGRQ